MKDQTPITLGVRLELARQATEHLKRASEFLRAAELPNSDIIGRIEATVKDLEEQINLESFRNKPEGLNYLGEPMSPMPAGARPNPDWVDAVPTVCQFCHRQIRFIVNHWEHIGCTLRHPAWPEGYNWNPE